MFIPQTLLYTRSLPPFMKAVILGVSDRSILWRYGRLKKEEYQNFVDSYSDALSGMFDNVIVTPDDGVYTDIAKEFGRKTGKKPIAYYPDKDERFGYGHLDLKNFEAKKINGDWYKLNAELVTKAGVVICTGISPGSMIELSYIKYHQKHNNQKIKLFVDLRCIEKPLPPSFEEQIDNLTYFENFDELKRQIKKEFSLKDFFC